MYMNNPHSTLQIINIKVKQLQSECPPFDTHVYSQADYTCTIVLYRNELQF